MPQQHDQLKAYIQQTAWKVGDEICEWLEKRMDEKSSTPSILILRRKKLGKVEIRTGDRQG